MFKKFKKNRIFVSGSILTILTALVIAAPPGPTIVDVAIQINSEGDFAGQFDTLIASLGEAKTACFGNPLRQRTIHCFCPHR